MIRNKFWHNCFISVLELLNIKMRSVRREKAGVLTSSCHWEKGGPEWGLCRAPIWPLLFPTLGATHLPPRQAHALEADASGSQACSQPRFCTSRSLRFVGNLLRSLRTTQLPACLASAFGCTRVPQTGSIQSEVILAPELCVTSYSGHRVSLPPTHLPVFPGFCLLTSACSTCHLIAATWSRLSPTPAGSPRKFLLARL